MSVNGLNKTLANTGFQPATSTTLDDFQMVNDADGVVTRTIAIPAGTYSVVCTIASTLTIGAYTYTLVGNTPQRIAVPVAASSYTLNANGYLAGFQFRNITGFTISNIGYVTQYTVGNRNAIYKTIAYGGSSNLFVVIPGGSSSTGGVTTYYTSPDTVTWTTRTFASARQFITYSGALFFALPSNPSQSTMLTSPDGITWTSRTITSGYYSLPTKGASTNYVMIRTPDASTSSGSLATIRSTDGFTWAAGGSLPSNAAWVACASDGTTDKMVAIAQYDDNQSTGTQTTKAAYSTNAGTSWTASTLPTTATWYSVNWVGGNYVAFNSGSTVYATSPDGITWTSRTNPFGVGLTTARIWTGTNGLGTGLFLATSTLAAPVYFTTDGITWTTASANKNAIFDGGNLNDVVYGNNIHLSVSTYTSAANTTTTPVLSTANAPIAFGIYNPPTTTL
jgi:hypothetical protein